MKKILVFLTLILCISSVSSTAFAQKVTVVSIADTSMLANTVDAPPEFPGGSAKLNRFVAHTLRYPANAREKNIQGRVILSFVVEKDGTLTDIKVVRSLSADTDAEALRIMKLSPKWKPGVYNSQPVKVQYALPISFALAN